MFVPGKATVRHFVKGPIKSELELLGLIDEAASNNIQIFRYNKSKD